MAPALNRTATRELFSKITDKYMAWRYLSGKGFGCGADQDFLSDQVWQLAEDVSTIHDSYSCNLFKNSQPFPTQRQDKYVCFATCAFCCNSTINPELSVVCPVQCRPKEHQDWLYC
jgi:hypothetical protein